MATSSLFERLGGQKAVDAAVDIFYRKVLADKQVNYFFDDVDMEKQIAKQKGFLTMVFGGPNHYNGKNLRDGHRHLVTRGLNDKHLDIIIEHLGKTLQELGVKNPEIQEIAGIANSVRADILNR